MDISRARAISLIAILLTLVTWMLAVPRGSTPDEGYHLASIWCSSGISESQCEPLEGSDTIDSIVLTPFISTFCYNRSPDFSANCDVAPTDGAMAAHQRFDGNDFRVFYYKVQHPLTHFGPVVGVTLMRLLNIGIFMFVFGAIIYMNLGVVRIHGLIALFLILVPQGLYLLASVNPSSWAITGVGTNWVFLLGLLNAKDRRTRFLNGGMWLFTLILAFSRLDSIGLLLFSAAMVLLFSNSSRGSGRKRLTSLVAIALAIVVLNERFGLLSTFLSSVGTTFAENKPDFFVYWLFHLVDIPAFSFGFNYEDFGPLGGSLEILLPAIIPIIVSGILVAVIAPLISRFSVRSLLFAVSSSGFLYIILLQQLSVEQTYNPYWVQGRYILPILPFIIGFLIHLSPNRDLNVRVLLTERLIWMGAAVAQSITLLTVVQRYSLGSNKAFLDLFSSEAWSYSPAIDSVYLWAIGTIAFAVFARSLIAIIRVELRQVEAVG